MKLWQNRSIKSFFKKASLIFALFLFLKSLTTPVYAASAALQLSPATGTYSIGQNFDVAVLLNTGGGRTSTTDMVITYPTSKVILADIKEGSIYDQYVGKSINNATGVASINGLASSTTTLFTGSGTFVTLNFKAIDSGTAEVKFSFTPGKRTDTNVVDFDAQDDILASVTNAVYTVSGTSSETTTDTASTGTNTTTANNQTSTSRNAARTNNMPVTASSSSTILLIAVSLIFIALGAFLTKFSFK